MKPSGIELRFFLSGTLLSSVTDVELEDSEAGLLLSISIEASVVIEVDLDLLTSFSPSFLGETTSLECSDSDDLDLGRGKMFANVFLLDESTAFSPSVGFLLIKTWG